LAPPVGWHLYPITPKSTTTVNTPAKPKATLDARLDSKIGNWGLRFRRIDRPEAPTPARTAKPVVMARILSPKSCADGAYVVADSAIAARTSSPKTYQTVATSLMSFSFCNRSRPRRLDWWCLLSTSRTSDEAVRRSVCDKVCDEDRRRSVWPTPARHFAPTPRRHTSSFTLRRHTSSSGSSCSSRLGCADTPYAPGRCAWGSGVSAPRVNGYLVFSSANGQGVG